MGNYIKDEGVTNLFSYLLNNESIEEININNVSFGQNEDTINKLIYLLENNPNLVIYHVKYIPYIKFTFIRIFIKFFFNNFTLAL